MYSRFQRFLTLLFVCTLSQISVESLEEEYLVDVRLLWEESDAGDRWKRDVDSGLPDHLSFAVPVQETDMKLRMRRSRLIPTVTSHSPLSTIYVEVDTVVNIVRSEQLKRTRQLLDLKD
ncbi:hypothetical protein PoB_004727800 [Plakobranchus ocellatus]|uniref:Uncharacterized protein n=1 Tax=Plakobranchus ocellatus TaxID=259542 RepID=A0AAV4BPQ5_9GAST|nr:hypothetical protein PoB_004727800 [Plakobranchus ocellatus]